MMTDDEYLNRATEEHVRRETMREENEIANIAGQMKHADQLADIHRTLCAKHGLKPDTTSPKMLSHAERLFQSEWTSFVASRYSAAGRVLDPVNAGFVDQGQVTTYLALRDKLWKEFTRNWPPTDLAEKVAEGTTDGIRQLHGHTA
jgi:hypothetical protein